MNDLLMWPNDEGWPAHSFPPKPDYSLGLMKMIQEADGVIYYQDNRSGMHRTVGDMAMANWLYRWIRSLGMPFAACVAVREGEVWRVGVKVKKDDPIMVIEDPVDGFPSDMLKAKLLALA